MIIKENLKHLLQAASHLIRLPQKHMWLDYDEQADVLYVHFEEKPSPNHNDMREDGIILDYNEKKLVGMTILDASQRQAQLCPCYRDPNPYKNAISTVYRPDPDEWIDWRKRKEVDE